MILFISVKQSAFAESNIAYKYPDLNSKSVGMQPIIEEEDFAPTGRRIPQNSNTPPAVIKKAPSANTSKDLAKAPIETPTDTIEAKADISIIIEEDFTLANLKENKSLNDYLALLKKDKSKTFKIHSAGIIGKDSSISTAKRRALSHALLLRQYLIDRNISSTRIDMNIDAINAASADNDFIEIY
jgi:hypothetical protein